MIVPNIRASFGRAEAAFVIWLLSRGVESERDRLEERLRDGGFDAVLDDPRTLNALLAGPAFSSASAELTFYTLVRHALLESGIGERVLADYLASLIIAFGRAPRAWQPEAGAQEFTHLVDIVSAGDAADGARTLMLRVHLGEFALWLSGLFPDHITARVQRRGAPGLEYYEQMGATGYRLAARRAAAEGHDLSTVYEHCADGFPVLRCALNRIADRHLFPATGDRIERLLRQVADEHRCKQSDARS